MDFPDSPAIGATVNNGISTWMWNGKQWERASAGAGGGGSGTDSASYRYLRASASNGGDGLSWSTAWNSLDDITLSAGQTVWMAAGTYPSSHLLPWSGTAGNPVTYKAATAGSHGTATGWNAATMAVDGAAGPVILNGGFNLNYDAPRQNITLDGQVRASLSSGHGIRCINGSYGDRAGIFAGGEVHNLTIRYVELGDPVSLNVGGNIDGIQGKGNGLLVEYCFVHDSDNKGADHGDGCQWIWGANLVFRFNLFRHCGQHIYMGEDTLGCQNVQIYYNVFDNRDSGSGGAAGWFLNPGGPTSGPVSGWTVYNNTVNLNGLGHSSYYVIYPANLPSLTLKNNAFYDVGVTEVGSTVHSFNGYDNASTGACSSIPTETGRLVAADLGFVSASTGDYRLTSGSPLRGVGTAVSLTMDILGNTVPAVPDIGAFQF